MKLRDFLRSPCAPDQKGGPAVCPHCWMVNSGPFILCGRCGADMRTFLQESGGLRRTAPVQSPVPVAAAHRLSLPQRLLVGMFLVILALSYLVLFLPVVPGVAGAETPGEVEAPP